MSDVEKEVLPMAGLTRTPNDTGVKVSTSAKIRDCFKDIKCASSCMSNCCYHEKETNTTIKNTGEMLYGVAAPLPTHHHNKHKKGSRRPSLVRH